MSSAPRSALLASLVFGLSPHANADHGDPGYTIKPAPDLILPTDTSIILRGFNSVPSSLDDLRKMPPRLKGAVCSSTHASDPEAARMWCRA